MAYLGRGTHTCVGCSFCTVEEKKSRIYTNSNCYQTTRFGLKCSLCNELLFTNCVQSIVASTKKKRNQVYDDFVPFYNALIEFSNNHHLKLAHDFIGHYCYITA